LLTGFSSGKRPVIAADSPALSLLKITFLKITSASATAAQREPPLKFGGVDYGHISPFADKAAQLSSRAL